MALGQIVSPKSLPKWVPSQYVSVPAKVLCERAKIIIGATPQETKIFATKTLVTSRRLVFPPQHAL